MAQTISDKQFQNACRSAALWFVALYMEAFLLRTNELQDDIKKGHLIEEIFNNGDGFDKDEGGTRTRVNSLWRIIYSGRIVQALGLAANSTRLKKDFPDAAKAAADLLYRIDNGFFILPKV